MPWKELENLMGRRFGRLTVIGPAPRKGKHVYWTCRCDCGNTKAVAANKLKSGNTRSCRCLQAESRISIRTKHGMTKSVEYRTWRHMMNRCYNPKVERFPHYGGRGIKVCERWHKFENFYKDMGPRPPGMSIDRIDNNGDYEPGNCRWATSREQCITRRQTLYLTYRGETLSLMEWSDKTGIPLSALRARMYYGWTPEKIIETPLRIWPSQRATGSLPQPSARVR